jgi:hypothetical protein
MGHGKRLHQHKRKALNSLFQAKLRAIAEAGLEPDVRKVFDGLSLEQALNLERQEILRHGRLDLGTGPLCNRTAGGQGTIGYKHRAATRLLLSAQRKGKAQTEAQLRANRGRKQSKQAREKISRATKGHRWHTAEQLESIRKHNATRTISTTTRQIWSAQRKGVKQTREHVEKVLATKAQKRASRTPEEQALYTQQTYAKRRGEKRSEETKKKMRAAWVARKLRAA